MRERAADEVRSNAAVLPLLSPPSPWIPFAMPRAILAVVAALVFAACACPVSFTEGVHVVNTPLQTAVYVLRWPPSHPIRRRPPADNFCETAQVRELRPATR